MKHSNLLSKKSMLSKKGYQPKCSVMLVALDWLPAVLSLVHKFVDQCFLPKQGTKKSIVRPYTGTRRGRIVQTQRPPDNPFSDHRQPDF